MKVIQCSVDGCTNESSVDIWPENDTRAWLCTEHFAQTNQHEWLTFHVGGRELMLDTAGSWFYIPERDERFHELARKEGLA